MPCSSALFCLPAPKPRLSIFTSLCLSCLSRAVVRINGDTVHKGLAQGFTSAMEAGSAPQSQLSAMPLAVAPSPQLWPQALRRDHLQMHHLIHIQSKPPSWARFSPHLPDWKPGTKRLRLPPQGPRATERQSHGPDPAFLVLLFTLTCSFLSQCSPPPSHSSHRELPTSPDRCTLSLPPILRPRAALFLLLKRPWLF